MGGRRGRLPIVNTLSERFLEREQWALEIVSSNAVVGTDPAWKLIESYFDVVSKYNE